MKKLFSKILNTLSGFVKKKLIFEKLEKSSSAEMSKTSGMPDLSVFCLVCEREGMRVRESVCFCEREREREGEGKSTIGECLQQD